VSTARLLRNTVRDQKDWKTVAFKQFHFFDPTTHSHTDIAITAKFYTDATVDDMRSAMETTASSTLKPRPRNLKQTNG
jgi:hypothetical protein